MLNTMTVFYDRMRVEDAAAVARTIVIDTGTVRATDFDLDRTPRTCCSAKGARQPWPSWTARRGSLSGTGQPTSAPTEVTSHPVMSGAVQARDALRSFRHRLHGRDQNGHRAPTSQAGS